MEEVVVSGASRSSGLSFWLVLALLLLVVLAIAIVFLLRRSRARRNSAHGQGLETRKTSNKGSNVEPAIAVQKLSPDKQNAFNIFVSYRRSDSSDVCGRMYDRLASEFGADHVFRDVDSINPGYDFQDIIDRHIDKAHVGLVLIGPDWAGFAEGETPRLQRGEDFVRIEVASLLSNDIPVIPVLVRGASVPSPEVLPEDLKSLVRRNFSQLRPDPDFNIDIDRLITALRRLQAG